MTYHACPPQKRILAHDIDQRAVDERREFKTVGLIQQNLVRQDFRCRRSFRPHQCVETKLSIVRKNVRTRQNHSGMSNRVGVAFPREDDLPPIEVHDLSSPNDSPNELARRISSTVIFIDPAANGSTLDGKSHGINWTMPVGVEIVTGSFVFTTRRAIPLNCALAFETVIVFMTVWSMA
jgi:hypothetical protein